MKKRNNKNEEINIITLNLEDEKPRNQEKKPRSRSAQKKPQDNKEFLKVTYLFVSLFLVMMGYLVYFNIVKSKEIINSPYNVRLNYMADRVVRGSILDREGNVLAATKVDENGTETRVYPYDNLFAHVVGYNSHGKAGLESTANFDLLTSNANFIEQLVNEFQENKNIGDNVITTLDVDVQQAAYNALGNYKGAVIVTEVTTGKVIAMVSKPDFDPNTIDESWEEIRNSSESVLLNRATQGAYAPGSIFKLVTTLAYMREDASYSEFSHDCEGEIEENGTIIHCAKKRAHGTEDLKQAFANSCNTAYAKIGLSLDIANYRNTAKNLLFNSKLPDLLPYTQSKFRLDKSDELYEVMMTSIGQGETQVSPYHMVLLSSAIANNGILMKPYLVDEIVNYTGDSVEKTMPEKYAQILTSKEAAKLKEYMTAVVENGTASSLNGQSYTVAGKTGTAEYSSDKEKAHSWFTGFTNIDNPELAICVVVESADNSGMSATTVAKKVLNAYYN